MNWDKIIYSLLVNPDGSGIRRQVQMQPARKEMMRRILLAIPLLSSAVLAQTAVPAAKKHVKILNGAAYKFTSKLKTVVELNFTMGYHHSAGKQVLATGLARVAKNNGFLVKRIVGPGNGGSTGVPYFTLTDLMAGQVIVANNVSQFGNTMLGGAKQSAIQQAIETYGRGYLGIHGSGDNTYNGWPWFTNALHPVGYQGHGASISVPVYRHLAEAQHIVLQGTFQTHTTVATIPNELNANGQEVLDPAPTRMIKDELYRYARDISRDPAYKDKVTMLLKYDSRNVPVSNLPAQYKRKGGNLFSYLYKVGSGQTSFLPSGHDNSDLLDPATGFDGGSGDFDKYFGQLLYFLAGYEMTPCDAGCNGLQIVDANNRLTGNVQGAAAGGAFFAATTGIEGLDEAPGMHFTNGTMGFASTFDEPFHAALVDVAGKVVAQKSGSGRTQQEFSKAGMKEGIYFLSVKIGRNAGSTKRYVVTRD